MSMIVALLITAALGAATGMFMVRVMPGGLPNDLFWSVSGGVLGALAIAGLGAWIGLYTLGDLMTYPSAITGAIMGVFVYNIIIAKE